VVVVEVTVIFGEDVAEVCGEYIVSNVVEAEAVEYTTDEEIAVVAVNTVTWVNKVLVGNIVCLERPREGLSSIIALLVIDIAGDGMAEVVTGKVVSVERETVGEGRSEAVEDEISGVRLEVLLMMLMDEIVGVEMVV
jgi:hypothetical protein